MTYNWEDAILSHIELAYYCMDSPCYNYLIDYCKIGVITNVPNNQSLFTIVVIYSVASLIIC